MMQGFKELEATTETRRRVLHHVARTYPEIYYGKRHDYKAKRKNNHYVIYRRDLDGDPWEEYGRIVIVDGMIFVNFVGMGINQYGDK